MNKTLGVGILGLGTVSQSVVDILTRENSLGIQRYTGCDFVIEAIAVRDLKAQRRVDITGIMLTDKIDAVTSNPKVDVVIELMGGTDEAFKAVSAALSNGKAVVTANKALIAERGAALNALCQQHQGVLLYEAAVAGGIPIIKVVREGLKANRIKRIAGILNGTSNYILTEMYLQNKTFETVLKDAQALGYAEADPTFDIEGVDASHKLAILVALATQTHPNMDAVYREGIGKVALKDIHYAKQMGYEIKQISLANIDEDHAALRVQPMLVTKKHLLSQVSGVLNAVLVDGNWVGETLYSGAGAGGDVTASAVVADLYEAAICLTKGIKPSGLEVVDERLIQYQSIGTVSSRYYLRFQVKDTPGVMKSISQVLANEAISIESLIQEEPSEEGSEVSITLLTNHVEHNTLLAVLDSIQQQVVLQEAPVFIQIFGASASKGC